MSKRRPGAPAPPSDPGLDDRVQKALDDALADSFPASDPVSIVTSQHEEAWERDRRAAGEPGRQSRGSRKGGTRH